MTEIPIELKLNSNFIYIFAIIDHFSKMSNSYLLKDKTKESILRYSKEFSITYGYPEEFRCDNGREF